MKRVYPGASACPRRFACGMTPTSWISSRGREARASDADPDRGYRGQSPPRQSLGDLAELTASIREKHPRTTTREEAGARFQIIAGERRYRRPRAGLADLPCIGERVVGRRDDGIASSRTPEKDLTPFEEADGLRRSSNFAIRTTISQRSWARVARPSRNRCRSAPCPRGPAAMSAGRHSIQVHFNSDS